MLIDRSKLFRKTSRRTAFTLMEVLVVVAILVVLAGVGGVIYMRIQEDAERDLAGLKINDIETALQSYHRQYKTYPASLTELAQPQDASRPYIDVDALIDPWGQPYVMSYPPQNQRNVNRDVPDIYSAGPDRAANTADDIGNWQQ